MQQSTSGLKTMLDDFYDWEAKQPNAPFLRQPYGDAWKTITWAEAGREARQMVAALRAMGLQSGAHIGIVSKNCYHWIIADLAIMMGGYVSVPFFPTLTAPQLAEVIELGDLEAIFVGKLDEWTAMKAGIPAELPILTFPHYEGNARVETGAKWEDLLARHEPVQESFRPGPEQVWTILFTSGTTGTPKGVVLEYRAPAALIGMERTHNAVGLFMGTEHRYFSYLPLNHIAERLIVELACMHNGGCISFAESLESFVKNLQQTRPTLFLGVPRIWSKFQLAILEKMPQHKLSLLLKIPILSSLVKKKIQKGLGLDQARVTFTGAAPAPDSLKQWFRSLGINVREVYGMTENCAGCSLMLRGANKDGTVGQLLPDVELKTDPESGEIIMRAPWLMRGYYKDAAKTREILHGGWLHTGDQGEVDAAGYLRITGRVADTFKSAKGKFIVPAPIEWGFAQNSYIEQICIVGLTLPQPVALTVLSEIGKNASRETVVQSLQQTLKDVNDTLANFERLAKVVVVRETWNVENGILTPTLKIKRNVVNQRYAPYLQQWYEQGEAIVWE